MKLRHLFVVNAVICLVYGAPFALVPALQLSLYGEVPNGLGLLVGRLFGALLLSIGFLCWKLKDQDQSDAARTLALALSVGDGLGCAFFVQALLAGQVNALGWLAAAIYGVNTVGFGAFALMGKAVATPS